MNPTHVPGTNTVCRFVRPKEWNAKEGRPRAGAFKAQNSRLSVWHMDSIVQDAKSVENLQFGSLAGSGQAHHTVSDYVGLASDRNCPDGFSVGVFWRVETTYVHEDWREWSDSHAQVEEIGQGSGDFDTRFPQQYRELLALNCRQAVPPVVDD